jgi:hypothetical protein
MRGDYYKTGIGLTTGFIGSHAVTHSYSVYTSQQLSLFSCSEDPGSNCCNQLCNQLLWRLLPLLNNSLTKLPNQPTNQPSWL